MNVVSFFAGCGGLDLGFRQAGFNVLWANDNDPAIKDSYLFNHPGTKLLIQDINILDPNEIPESDGFIGGPPCQPWSIAGKQRGLTDKRGKLFNKYISIIKIKKPKFFLIENVKGILNPKFKDVFNDFIESLSSAGYNVSWKLLNVLNYRIPQIRERVFIIGIRDDINGLYKFPDSVNTFPITLRQAIGDIVGHPKRYRSNDIIKENLELSNHDVLEEEFGEYYFRSNRLKRWDEPSFTIHATACNEPLHPCCPGIIRNGFEDFSFIEGKETDYRRLSIRECARIQTFPDSFVFKSKSINSCYRMIGNAVPPRLGYYIALSIQNFFNLYYEQKK